MPFLCPYVTLMLLLFEMGVIWELHRSCLGFATKALLIVYTIVNLAFALGPFYLRFRSVVSPFLRMGEKHHINYATKKNTAQLLFGMGATPSLVRT